MTTRSAAQSADVAYMSVPEGRVAYEVAGEGPLVVLVPGMGDLRTTYRFLAPALRGAGYRVASMDLRGHGHSDATFSTYGDVATAADMTALIELLGEPAVVVGNSMAAGSAVLVAAQRPELVSGLVLVGPFVRNPSTSVLQQIMLRVAMAPVWAGLVWKAYLPKLYAGRRPADFEDYLKQVIDSLGRTGHAKALSLTTHTTHAPAEARLKDVSAKSLVIMGELDPDFGDPRAEADWIAGILQAEVVMVPEAGHSSYWERPEIFNKVVLDFLGRHSK